MTDRVLITGGTGGIGAASARRLAASGYAVVFTYDKSKEDAHLLERELRNAHGYTAATALHCDLTDPATAHTTIAGLIAETGPFYGLLYSAGVSYDCLAAMVDMERAERLFRVNFFSLVAISKILIRDMIIARRGRIVALSSVASEAGRQGNGIYSASKAAMEGYMRCLSEEIGRYGITVTWIKPGFIQTKMISEYPHLDALAKRPTLRRLGTVGDVAQMAAYLMSQQSAYVHGTGLVIDGGLTAGVGLV